MKTDMEIKRNRDLQTKYRNKLYGAGYKRINIWVYRDIEEKPGIGAASFIKKLEGLTRGQSAKWRSKLYHEMICHAKQRVSLENLLND